MKGDNLIRLCTLVTVIVAAIMVIGKVATWFITGSAAVLAISIDKVGDLVASVAVFVAARVAMLPPDKNFRWGYYKVEPLASLGVGAFVCSAALLLLFENALSIGSLTAIVMPELVIAVMLIGMLLNGSLFLFQRWVVKHTESTLIHADSVHYKMDFLLNLSVIVAVLLQPVWLGFDLLFSILIAAYIIWHTYDHVLKPSVMQLIDRELSEQEKEQILEIVKAHPDVIGYHDLRTRKSGRFRFIQVHLELGKLLYLEQAHEIADAVEKQIEAEFPNAEVIVHMDPV